jgi:hypothetical protein
MTPVECLFLPPVSWRLLVPLRKPVFGSYPSHVFRESNCFAALPLGSETHFDFIHRSVALA